MSSERVNIALGANSIASLTTRTFINGRRGRAPPTVSVGTATTSGSASVNGEEVLPEADQPRTIEWRLVPYVNGELLTDAGAVVTGLPEVTISIIGPTERVKTVSGDVLVTGDVSRAQTVSGDIRATRVTGGARTMSGDIHGAEARQRSRSRKQRTESRGGGGISFTIGSQRGGSIVNTFDL